MEKAGKMDRNEILRKLHFQRASNPLIINAPDAYIAVLEGIVHDREISEKKAGSYDFIQIFATTQAHLEALVRSVENAGIPDCLFWACYPKGTGKIRSDIRRETVWEAFALINLKPVANIAIDDTWSALRARPI